jgi:hypothetical protein
VIVAVWGRLKGRKRFFFEKKKQKTFIHWSLSPRPVAACEAPGKRFFLLFFKKEALPSTP